MCAVGVVWVIEQHHATTSEWNEMAAIGLLEHRLVEHELCRPMGNDATSECDHIVEALRGASLQLPRAERRMRVAFMAVFAGCVLSTTLIGAAAIADIGRLTVRLGECRYPAADPNSDAFAQMVITDRNSLATLFDGWMVASAPALSSLDDARYDVWVMACKTA